MSKPVIHHLTHSEKSCGCPTAYRECTIYIQDCDKFITLYLRLHHWRKPNFWTQQSHDRMRGWTAISDESTPLLIHCASHADSLHSCLHMFYEVPCSINENTFTYPPCLRAQYEQLILVPILTMRGYFMTFHIRRRGMFKDLVIYRNPMARTA